MVNSENLLDKMLALIRKNPGIRASEINRRLGKAHTWSYRKKLIEKGLVRRKKDGAAVRYYPKWKALLDE